MLRLPALVLLPLIFALSLATGLLTSFALERATTGGHVGRGIAVCGRGVSGLNGEELDSVLARCADGLERTPLRFRLKGATAEFSAGDLGLTLDRPQMVVRTLRLGRTGSLPDQVAFWLARFSSWVPVAPQVAVDGVKVQRSLGEWASARLAKPQIARIEFSVPPQADYGAPGEALDEAALKRQLGETFAALAAADHSAQGGLPLDLPIRALAPAVSREQVDASLARAQRLLAEPLVLASSAAEQSFSLSGKALASALSSRPSDAGALELALDLATLRERLGGWFAGLERPARDAEFLAGGRGRLSIEPSVEGLAVDEAGLKKAILAVGQGGSRRIVVALLPVTPRLTTDLAEGLGVKELLASFVTMHDCCQPRVDNIHLAAKKIDGTVLRPGETFSLNAALGPRTQATGYRAAPTIVHGEMEQTWGGGVSQLATTLFNAALDAGLQIIQRQPHSFYFARYPEGHEATVSFPEPDLSFRNDTEAGLVIKTQFTGTFIKVLLLGDNGGRRVQRHKSKRYNIVQFATEYEEDESRDPAEPQRVRAGQLGWTVLVSRSVRFPDGRQEEQKREVVYRPRAELLRVHPCTIPEGEPGYTGDECPEPEEESEFADEPREFEDRGYWADPRAENAEVIDSEE